MSSHAITISEAGRLLREGGVVAFPTETVYGLGANALDERAVRRIFELKGRPSTSPLIVHVAALQEARALAAEWPAEAELLAGRHWPGPLTLVVKKDPRIPGIVTAGLDTVGLRVPSHPIALALLREAGVPVAAPSANRFTELSPTTAAHVRQAFGDAVPVLEGGDSEVGIESTVVSVVDGLRLLRPGVIVFDAAAHSTVKPAVDAPHEAPGLHERHYAPRTRVVLVNAFDPLPESAVYVYWDQPRDSPKTVQLPGNPRDYAAALYRTLHDLDGQGFAAIAVERVPDGADWAGVRDRLARASH